LWNKEFLRNYKLIQNQEEEEEEDKNKLFIPSYTINANPRSKGREEKTKPKKIGPLN